MNQPLKPRAASILQQDLIHCVQCIYHGDLPHSPQPATTAEQATVNQAFDTIPRYLEATQRVAAALIGRMGTGGFWI